MFLENKSLALIVTRRSLNIMKTLLITNKKSGEEKGIEDRLTSFYCRKTLDTIIT